MPAGGAGGAGQVVPGLVPRDVGNYTTLSIQRLLALRPHTPLSWCIVRRVRAGQAHLCGGFWAVGQVLVAAGSKVVPCWL